MKINKTGLLFLIIHTCFISYIVFQVFSPYSYWPKHPENGMIFIPVGMIFDQMPFLFLLIMSQIPLIGILAENSYFFMIAFITLGGLQWYLTGWILSLLLSKDTWKGISEK